MKKIFKRQDVNQIDFNELGKMGKELNDYLNSDFINNKTLKEDIDYLLEFQSEDGSFNLLNSFEIPSDARVEYCYTPTYIVSAILMKTLLSNKYSDNNKLITALSAALNVSSNRNLAGHGYERVEGQIDALSIFSKGDVVEFCNTYEDVSIIFSKMIKDIVLSFHTMLKNDDYRSPFGDSYKKEIVKTIKLYKNLNIDMVFVYGTLKSNNYNNCLLKDSTFMGTGSIYNYDMYDAGHYPAIIKGEGIVSGELYEINSETLSRLDRLESEGTLYKRVLALIKMDDDSYILAYVYEYIDKKAIVTREKIGNHVATWNSDTEYVWYVSYGSNLLYERLKLYIVGGENKRLNICKEGMENKNLPIDTFTLEIPYNMYFGSSSNTWGGTAVSFLDTSKKGFSYGKAYLITKKQYQDLRTLEGRSNMWYNKEVELGEYKGIKVKTITNNSNHKRNKPSNLYLQVIREGLREGLRLDIRQVNKYLDNSISN